MTSATNAAASAAARAAARDSHAMPLPSAAPCHCLWPSMSRGVAERYIEWMKQRSPNRDYFVGEPTGNADESPELRQLQGRVGLFWRRKETET